MNISTTSDAADNTSSDTHAHASSTNSPQRQVQQGFTHNVQEIMTTATKSPQQCLIYILDRSVNIIQAAVHN